MNPGICYLYEFKNSKKLRNVGFMKVTPHYRSCILQINARGISVPSGESLRLLALFEKGSESIAKPIDELPCQDKNIYGRLTVTDSAFPDGKCLKDLGGFLLLSSSGQCYAAITDNMGFDTEKIKMWEEKPETVTELVMEPVTGPVTEPGLKPALQPTMETAMQSTMEPAMQPTMEPALQPAMEPFSKPVMEAESLEAPSCMIEEENRERDTQSSENISEGKKIIYDEKKMKNEGKDISHLEQQQRPTFNAKPDIKSTGAGDLNTECEKPSQEKVRKIQRSELTILPRKCWNLANNSFLMHGYNNYNHLLIVEEDGHFWLGVPGIYAPREARAAELCGFPQFTQTYNNQLKLDKDECDNNEKFGYWCRFIR